MKIEQIAAYIRRAGSKTTPVLIGIEGYGGAGKTTVARKLAARLGNAYVVSMDDFIVKERLSEPSWDGGAFDRQRLERQVLIPAQRGQLVRYQRLVWETNTLSPPILVPRMDYLIIEGIASYHPSIERYYVYTIWVETPLELAQERGHARDGSQENAHYWGLWMENDLAYQQAYHSDQRADYVYTNA